MRTGSINMTSRDILLQNGDVEILKSVCNTLDMYYLPGIIAIGLFCNVFLTVLLLATKMKKRYYSQIFAAISICDFGFIVTILMNWIHRNGFDVLWVPGLCQILTCAMHFFPFLSFWLTIWGSYGLIIRNPFSFLTQSCASPGKARTLIISLAIFTFTVYVYKTWTFGVLVAGGRTICTVLPEVRDVVLILSMIDVIVMLVIPYIFITYFDVCISFFVLKKYIFKSQTERFSFTNDNLYIIISDSILFHIFVGPGCIYKLIFIFKTLSHTNSVNIEDPYVDVILQTVFYTFFSLRPIVHLILSSNIHSILSDICFKARESISLSQAPLPTTNHHEQTLL